MKTAVQMLEALVATSRKLGPYVLLDRNPRAAKHYVAKARQALKRAVAVTRNAFRRRIARAPSLMTGVAAAMRALG